MKINDYEVMSFSCLSNDNVGIFLPSLLPYIMPRVLIMNTKKKKIKIKKKT